VGTYLGILVLIFVAVPLAIIIVRKLGIADLCSLQSLISTVPFERMKGLVLQNRELSKRPIARQLEAFLYAQTNWGFMLDLVQAMLSMLSVALFIANTYQPPGSVQSLWSVGLELFLTLYFAADYSLHFYLAHDRLAFYLSPSSLLDYVTIVPGLVSTALSENAFDPEAWVVARTMRVFRIFRVVRMVRVVALAPGSSLQRQIGILAATVFSMVLAAAGIYQIVESTPEKPMR